MNSSDNAAIGLRIRTLRKRKGYNQQELADILGKSLRTVQKYESGEIEVSIAMANQLAKVLDTTPTFLFGYETEITPIRSLADVAQLCLHAHALGVRQVDYHTRPADVLLKGQESRGDRQRNAEKRQRVQQPSVGAASAEQLRADGRARDDGFVRRQET